MKNFQIKIMQCITKNHKRLDFPADNFQNKASYLKLNKPAMSGLSDRPKIASIPFRIPTEFRTRISRNNESKTRLIELLLTYIKEQKDEYLNISFIKSTKIKTIR